MSRIITQQLTRHRNAITQESQRYVDYSEAKFNSPAKFKKGSYETDYDIHTSLGSFTGNMDDIGNGMIEVYGELVKQNVAKEDARGFLPSNVQCGKIYITFTYRSLIQFLSLRTDKHAQAEIRYYACIIKDAFDKYVSSISDFEKNYLEIYTIPRYMFSEVEREDIDQPLGEIKEESSDDWNGGSPVEPISHIDKYASTREDDKEIKRADSGKYDV
jgi:thymidylate synthase ThyX